LNRHGELIYQEQAMSLPSSAFRPIGSAAVVLVLEGLFTFGQAARAGDVEPPPIPPQVFPEPMSDDETGFVPIFDGKTLKNWDGDSAYWRVENGAIVGETTEEHLPKYNSFIIWRGGKPSDFELKADYRVSDTGNSGLQYRSVAIPGVKWVLRGYQFDIDGAGWGQMFYDKFAREKGVECNRVTGQNYEERGRTFLALPGQVSQVLEGRPQRVIASLGNCMTVARAANNDWNKAYLIVRGNVMIHILNGQLMSVVVDEDKKNRVMKGLMGMQVHVGPPMKVEFRNIRIKLLAPHS
jgi:hypothetical protein